jgi:hypothetical protein
MITARLAHLVKRKSFTNQACCLAIAVLVTLVWPMSAGAIPFEAAGANAGAIQATVDAFRAALGDPNNGNSPGPLVTGRREINWDGGGQSITSSGTPFNGFQNTRGAQFTTLAPGTGFIQAPPSLLATNFNNPSLANFLTFSDPRLFSPTGSTLTNVGFFVPGTNGGTPATTTGFGAVFSDVDSSANASLTFFSAGGVPLGPPFPVPAFNGGLSFLGVIFPDNQRISQVQIISGNVPLGGATEIGATDIIVMDDFLYREPAAVPEPTTLLLVGTTMGGLGLAARWRQRRRKE